MNHDELETLLTSKPSSILEHELALIELTTRQANDIHASDIIKTAYKTDADMNKNFKNEGERKASVELLLRENQEYQEYQKMIPTRAKEIQIAQVNLEYQENLFQAYLTIAGMKE